MKAGQGLKKSWPRPEENYCYHPQCIAKELQ